MGILGVSGPQSAHRGVCTAGRFARPPQSATVERLNGLRSVFSSIHSSAGAEEARAFTSRCLRCHVSPASPRARPPQTALAMRPTPPQERGERPPLIHLQACKVATAMTSCMPAAFQPSVDGGKRCGTGRRAASGRRKAQPRQHDAPGTTRVADLALVPRILVDRDTQSRASPELTRTDYWSLAAPVRPPARLSNASVIVIHAPVDGWGAGRDFAAVSPNGRRAEARRHNARCRQALVGRRLRRRKRGGRASQATVRSGRHRAACGGAARRGSR